MTSARIQQHAARYKELVQVLAREHEFSLALEECLAERDRLTVQIQAKQAELSALTENSKKEFEQSRKLKHLSVRSAAAMLAGNKREKIAESEQRYHAAFETEQNCKRQIEQLSIELGTMSEKERELKAAMDDVRDAKTQMTALLDEIFAEPSPEYPLEPQLKAELQNYMNQKSMATRDQGRFRDADHNLVQAVSELRKVQRLIEAASDYMPFDFFGGVLDSRQIQWLETARLHVYEVQRRMNVAREVLPEIPHAGTLDCVSNNAFLSIQLYGTYVDVAWKAKAQHCMAVLSAVHRNIDNSIRWIRDYMRYTEGALNRLQVAIDSTRNALENERRRIVDHVLSGASADAFQSEAGVNLEEPPPMYEAPPEDTAALTPPSVPNAPAAASPNSSISNASPYSPMSSPPASTAPPTPDRNSQQHNNPFSSNPFFISENSSIAK